jgi:hypothetical protein
MNREKSIISYSESDKKHIVVKKYLDTELDENTRMYKIKRNKRRICFIVILILLVLASLLIKSLQFPLYIALAFMIFLILVYEFVDRINLEAISRKYYFEVQVLKKMPAETCAEGTLTPGTDISVFYPVEARDITSGYMSKFYINKEQYDGATTGSIIRISTKGERL